MRLIDANALAKHIKDLPTWWADDGGVYPGGSMKYPDGMYYPEDIISSIDNAPTGDAVEVVHAEWLDGYGVCDNKKSYISIDCSNCGEYFKLPSIDENIEEWKKRFAYCPFCGAKMDGGNEDD